ncbi:mitogen-activated protein kinase kinase kinase 15 [Ctenodactylus gundi]
MTLLTNIAIVDLSDISKRPSLFYHFGVREHFNMANNVILYCDSDLEGALALKTSRGNYYLIPYIVTPCDNYIFWDSNNQRQASESMQSKWESLFSSLCMPLLEKLISLLKDICVTSSPRHKQILLNDIRRAREKYQGDDLLRELIGIQLRMDSIEALSSDIIINLLLSYRDIQNYDAMVNLVETLEMLPMCDVAHQYEIKFYYAFALNRRNSKGDRRRALQAMIEALQSCDYPSADMFCLCGRIYKDIFLDSDCKDLVSRDKAIEWYRKGYELQSSLYSGTNLAVLLIVAEQHFETSTELSNIGVQLNALLVKKGSLKKMSKYWEVGKLFTVSLLAIDMEKTAQAAERFFILNPPAWYLRSVVQDLSLIRRFKKSVTDHSPKQKQLHFWLDMISEATEEVTRRFRIPVLLVEATKVYQPSYMSISNEADGRKFSLWRVLTTEKQHIHKWDFTASSIKGIRFFILVRDMISNREGSILQLEESIGDSIEYDFDENGKRVVLGKGIYGIVYAGRDKRSSERIAIKEILERDCRYSQILHNEISLYRNLKHRNVIQYLGSVSEGGYIKVFMEQVPGGTPQYMAPEIIEQGPLGYRPPADIWSLGCTLIEMATGKPPLHNFGEPLEEILKLLMFKVHPEIPETLSSEAKAFILSCFNPNPYDRITATDLLKAAFLREENKDIRNQTDFRLSGTQSATCTLDLPLVRELFGNSSSSGGDGSSGSSDSSMHDSFSSDSSAQPDMFFENAHAANHRLGYFLSAPDKNSVFEVQNTAMSPEDRDSEHQPMLHRILWEEQTQVASNLKEYVAQSSEELRLTVDHIKQIIDILRNFCFPEHSLMASMLLELQSDLDSDSLSINQIRFILLRFQDAVNKILRSHLTRPHCMFAMDDIFRAVQAAVTALSPELQTHSVPTSGTEVFHENSPLVNLPDGEMCVQFPRNRPSSVVTEEAPNYQQNLDLQLRMFREESNRCLGCAAVGQSWSMTLREQNDVTEDNWFVSTSDKPKTPFH